ncbi:MAG: ACT domain-containing protein [Pseudomonadales bacterium]|nr:ACT domain-containing protein [Pseudomonadales bacterium]
MTTLVLTVIGDDQPGLVEKLAQTISRHQGSWLESNMSHLAGKFAGILRVSVEAAHEEELIAALHTLSDGPLALRVLIEKAASPSGGQKLRTLRLNLVGNDRPGIIREVSRALASQQVNVQELVTHCSSAPMSAETLFHAQALLQIPASLDPQLLQAELERIADDLIVEISLDWISAD